MVVGAEFKLNINVFSHLPKKLQSASNLGQQEIYFKHFIYYDYMKFSKSLRQITPFSNKRSLKPVNSTKETSFANTAAWIKGPIFHAHSSNALSNYLFF
jgi:hypothetical protein